MAGTIADGALPRMIAKMGPSLAQAETAPPADKESHEPELEAYPRLDRSVFLYLEPRDGFDGKGYFAQCSSCSNFVPESLMRGAVRGGRCALFGSGFPVSDDSSCGLYAPWATGAPCEALAAVNAAGLVKGVRSAVAPYDAGFVRDTKVRCENCVFIDALGDGTNAPECELYEALNEKAPKVFDLNKAVKLSGCCNAFCSLQENSLG